MVEKRWVEPTQVQLSATLRSAIGGHPLVAELLARRGISDVHQALAFLDPALYVPAFGTDIPDLSVGVTRIKNALERGERIWIWGDFDVDGQTATAILVESLRGLGGHVKYHVPSRSESHGVNLPALREILAEGVDLLITCDTGISAVAEVGFLAERGVDAIVTDHHDLPAALPAAMAIINPKRLPPDHALRELTGAGCAYKVMELLHDEMGVPERNEGLLDLTAIGLVGDVGVLAADVRHLVQRGLEVLRRTERLGLLALMERAGLSRAGVSEDHIGFVIAPRLNALGRLGDARDAVELLLTKDPIEAATKAATVEGLNDRRRLLVSQVMDAAEDQIKRDRSLLREAALVVAHERWPAGVIGIVAGRLSERYAKPTILIALNEEGMGSASARSVPGCDIHAAIAAQADLLERFGGHPMAAGFAIHADRIPEFRRRLNQSVAEMLAESPYIPVLYVDAYVTLPDATLALAEELGRLAPFGNGNPAISLAVRDVKLKSEAVIGRTQEHRRLVVQDEGGETKTVLQWHSADEPVPVGCFDLAFSLSVSDYQGERQPQMVWIDARQREEEVSGGSVGIEVTDYRRVTNAAGVLRGLLSKEATTQVWAEGADRPDGSRDRRGLEPADALVVWTAPPGAEELQAVLAQVRPMRVYLFAIDPELDEPQTFARRLLGLVKSTLSEHGGISTLENLAAAMSHRPVTVRVGLQWLAAKGSIHVHSDDGQYRFAQGTGVVSAGVAGIERLLRALLEETRAYRKHLLSADANVTVRAKQ